MTTWSTLRNLTLSYIVARGFVAMTYLAGTWRGYGLAICFTAMIWVILTATDEADRQREARKERARRRARAQAQRKKGNSIDEAEVLSWTIRDTLGDKPVPEVIRKMSKVY